jgi:hypothetical protein
MVTTFWILSTRQKLPHTTVDIPTKFHEVCWKESKFFMLKKMKNTKMIIAGYSPNRNWWNLIGTTSTWISQKNRNRLDKLCRSCHGNKKKGVLKNVLDSFHQT